MRGRAERLMIAVSYLSFTEYKAVPELPFFFVRVSVALPGLFSYFCSHVAFFVIVCS